MAREVEVVNAARRRAPWINTATWINDSDKTLSMTEVLEKANLNWEVRHTPLFTSVNGHSVELDNKVATTRVNNDGSAVILGITSPTYSIVQNESIVELVDSVMFESGAVIQSAGELRGGRKIFVAAKLPENVELSIKAKDPIDTMLVASNTHDGTDSLRFEIVHLRQICTNGMMRWTKANSIAFRHTSRMSVRVEDIKSTLGVILKSTEEFNLLSSSLMEKEVTNSNFWSIVTKLLPIDEHNMTPRQIENVEERRNTVRNIWNGPTQENIKGTAWGTVQAFGEFEQWARITRSNTDFDRAERFMLNQGNTLTEKALELVK